MGTSHASDTFARGTALLRAGDVGEAVAQLVEARRERAGAGDALGAARVDVELALAVAARGEVERAAAWLDEALAVAERLGDADLAARVRLAQGETASLRGDETVARGAWLAARRHYEAYWDGAALALIYAGLARSEPDPVAAATLAGQALEEGITSGDPLAMGRAHAALARARGEGGDPEGAARSYEDATQLFAAFGLRRELAAVYLAHGVLLGELGSPAASGLLAHAYRLYRELGALGELERVREAFQRFGRRAVDRGGDLALHRALRDLDAQVAAQPELGRVADGVRLAVAGIARERGVARTLLDLVRALAVEDPARQPLALARMAAELCRADRALVALIDDSGQLELTAGLRMPEQERAWRGPAEQARSRPVRLSGDGTSPSVLACPLRRGARLFGVIYCDKAVAGGTFGATDLAALVGLAEQAAALFESGRLAELLRREAQAHARAVDALPEGLITLSPGGRVVTCNRAAATFLGLSGDAAPVSLGDWPELAAAAVREPPHALTLPGGAVHVEARAVSGSVDVTTVLVLTDQARAATLARRGAFSAREVGFADLVGPGPAMRRVVRAAELAATTPDPLLLVGEPGTGRRLLARAVHGASPRAGAPLAVVDCGGAPRRAAAEELFGAPARPGLVDVVDDGALLLVEVTELPLDAQARLAAFIAERRGPRIYATTQVVLDEGARRPMARELARVLRPGALNLPPLRERGGDLEALVDHLLPRLSEALGKVVTSMAPEVLEVLAGHPWPGNVRELEQVLEQEVYAAGREQDLLFAVPAALAGDGRAGSAAGTRSLLEVEHQLLLAALKQHRGNVPRVARTLGVSKGTVYNMMRKFRVDPATYRVS